MIGRADGGLSPPDLKTRKRRPLGVALSVLSQVNRSIFEIVGVCVAFDHDGLRDRAAILREDRRRLGSHEIGLALAAGDQHGCGCGEDGETRSLVKHNIIP